MTGPFSAVLETLPVANIYGLIAGVFLLSAWTNFLWMRRWSQRNDGRLIAVLQGASGLISLMIAIQFAIWAYTRHYWYLRITESPISLMILLLLLASVSRLAAIFHEDRQLTSLAKAHAKYTDSRKHADT